MRHRLVDALALGESWVHRLDARVKTSIAGMIVVTVALLPPTAPVRLAALAAAVVAGAVAAQLPLGALARRLGWILPVVALPAALLWVAAPAGADGNHLQLPLHVAARALVAASATLLLVATTPMSDLLDALRWLRVPRPLVSVVGLLYRYLFVVADEALRMSRARTARGGRRRGGPRTAAQLLSTLALRSYDRAEQIHRAMLARGLAGPPREAPRPPLRRWDLGVLLLVAGLLGALLVAPGLWLEARP